MNGDTIIRAAERIEAAVAELAGAYRELHDELGVARREAWQVGGHAGAADLANVAEPSRVDEEIARHLAHAGLSGMLQQGRSTVGADVVPDLVERWRLRIARGQLETTRREANRALARAPLPGQTLVRHGRAS